MVDFMLLHRLQFKHPAYLILGKKANSRQIVSTLYFCVARKRKIDSKVLMYVSYGAGSIFCASSRGESCAQKSEEKL